MRPGLITLNVISREGYTLGRTRKRDRKTPGTWKDQARDCITRTFLFGACHPFVDTDHNIHAIPIYLFSQQIGADPVQERVHYSHAARSRQQHAAAVVVVTQEPPDHVFVQHQDHGLQTDVVHNGQTRLPARN